MPHQCTDCGRTFPDGSKEMLSGCPDCGGNKFQFTPASEVDDTDGSRSTETGTPGGQTSSSGGHGSNTGRGSDTDDGRTEWPTHGDEPEAAERSKPVSPTEAGDHPAADSGDRSSADSGDRSSADSTEFVDSGSNPAGAPEREPGEDSAQASARSEVVNPDELSVANRESASRRRGDTDSPEPTAGAERDPNRGDSDRPASQPGSGPETEAGTDRDRPELDDLRAELNDQFESIRIVSPGKYELNLMELYDRQEYIISLQEDGRYVIEMPNSIEERGE